MRVGLNDILLTMTTLHPNASLILIDIQQGFDHPMWGPRNNLQAEENAAKLLQFWRATKRPIFFIRHDSRDPIYPLHPASPGNQIKAIVQPQLTEPVIGKNVNSAFIGTDLSERLKAIDCKQLIICGLTTDHCVSTTTRMAGNFGFDVLLPADACATFDRKLLNGQTMKAEQVHQINLASLHHEFAEVVTTEEILLCK